MKRFGILVVGLILGVSIAGLALATGPPTNLKLVGDHWTAWDPPEAGPDAYLIQKGDTLWDLAEQWFGDPFSVRQLISWFLLVSCIVPVVYGVHALRTQGKPDARRPHDAPLIWIEKTTQLVTTGAFKYIRHPLYSSLLLLAWGVFFKHPSWVAGGVVLGATAFLLATAKVEEVENVRYFGAAYRVYMQHTKMFIPFVL